MDARAQQGYPGQFRVSVPRPARTTTRLRSASVFLLLVLVFSSLLDIPPRIQLGAFTLSSAMTLSLLLLGSLLCLALPIVPRGVASSAAMLAAFFGWVTVAILSHPPNELGLQNAAVILVMLVMLLLSARESHLNPSFAAWAGTTLTRAVLFAALLYIVSSVASPFVGGRQFALFAVVGLAWPLSRWTYGSRKHLWFSLLIIAIVGASLSRLGFVVALITFAIAQFQPGSSRKRVRVLVTIVSALLAILAAITFYEPLNRRFFEYHPVSELTVGGVSFNSEGRARMWSTTFESFKQSPWSGHGPGSAALIIRERYGLDHPHNDYLRIAHDYGIIGIGLWALAFIVLLRKTYRRWKIAHFGHEPAAVLHKSAFLALVVVGLSMFTDNSVAYTFVMAPLSILVGASLGLRPTPTTQET